ncbi:MAG TPA: hypothetical protein VKV22_13145, partial [Rhodanobacteraceae bacterium]|nr:hypothetical protein [Rhodanobacteraceae bacterium]
DRHFCNTRVARMGRRSSMASTPSRLRHARNVPAKSLIRLAESWGNLSTKDHCAWGGGLGNVLLPRLPLPLGDRAPARLVREAQGG